MRGLIFILPDSVASAIGKRVRFFTRIIMFMFPFLESDLKERTHEDVDGYVVNSVISPLVLSSFPLLMYAFGWTSSLYLSFISTLVLFFFFFLVNIYYPRIKTTSEIEELDKYLVYVLRDLLIQVRSSVLLYDAIINVVKSNYGIASDQFKEIENNIKKGMSEQEAFKLAVLKTKNQFLKKVLWQLNVSLYSGGKVEFILFSLLETLKEHLNRQAEKYVNLVSLSTTSYLLLGTVLPLLGITFSIIVLSSFGSTIDSSIFLVFLALSFIVQIFIIGYIKTSRPSFIR